MQFGFKAWKVSPGGPNWGSNYTICALHHHSHERRRIPHWGQSFCSRIVTKWWNYKDFAGGGKKKTTCPVFFPYTMWNCSLIAVKRSSCHKIELIRGLLHYGCNILVTTFSFKQQAVYKSFKNLSLNTIGLITWQSYSYGYERYSLVKSVLVNCHVYEIHLIEY